VADDPYPLPHWTALLLRGLLRRCPRCGSGHLFKGWLQMVERCPRCGLKFEREEGFFLGAFVINSGTTLIALAAFIAIGVAKTLPNPPPGKLAVVGLLVAVVVPVFFYPFSRTIWAAIHLWMQPLSEDEVETAAEATARDR
jgi:uncharacterized protein (DUF983 family)